MTDKEIKYGNTSIKTYNVNYSENNSIIARESDYEKPVVTGRIRNDKEIYLINYISALYSGTVKGIPIETYTIPGIIDYTGDYLIVVENDYSITKKVFDLRNIELPENTKQEILEIQEFLKRTKKGQETSKFVPLIQGIIDNKITPLIKKDDEDGLRLFYDNTSSVAYERRYLSEKNKSTYITNFDYLTTYILVSVAATNNNFANIFTDHFVLATAGYVGLFVCINRLFNKIGKNNIKKSVDSDFNDYLELCNKIINGDKMALESLSEDIGRVCTYNNSNNSEFYLSLVRDLAVLNCYKDESLTTIKQELLSLGCEYVEYSSASSKNEMIEEIFMNKLKAIEAEIDLTNKKLEEDDDDTMNFIKTHCESDEENRLRLLPVVNKQEEFNKQYIKKRY